MLVNQRRAEEFMARYDLEALIATTHTNVSYFTGYDCWQYAAFRENMLKPGAPESLVQAYGILIPRKRPVLVTDIYTAAFPVEEGVEVRPFGVARDGPPHPRKGEPKRLAMIRHLLKEQRPSAGEALSEVLEETGIIRGRVGIELSNLSAQTRSVLRKRLPAVTFLDAPQLIRFVRMVKTEDEIGRIRRAASIAEKAMVAGLSKARAGGTAGDVRRPFLVEVARNDALFEHWAFSPMGFGQSDDRSYRFAGGDYSSVDVGCIYQLYYADTGTTVVFGGERPDVSRLYGDLWDVVEECKDSLRPGATPLSILERFSRAYESRAIKGVDYQGHGIGLETREHPIIAHSKYRTISDQVVSRDTEIPLEEGMVINIETPLNFALKGGYQLEKTFLIGKRSVSEITPKRDPIPFTTA
jgi:Xaa-Pro aminopeptidase